MSERSNPIKMIDVSDKEIVHREAEASGRIYLKAETLEKIRDSEIKKGGPLPAAEIACILAVKKTPDVLPLCHPIPITSVDVEFQIAKDHI
ncbi:MAG: cyclic pyranopterin monophosphate synthase MoaC, partial [Candidatus Hydrothermarchaeota archaeon]|nr:cyclic pyranopterin monophosphate synthase MoaC [Candidatus Hydrothermarchaeota archaeon]